MLPVYEGEVLVSALKSITKLESSLVAEWSFSSPRSSHSLKEYHYCRTESCAVCTSLRLRTMLARDPERQPYIPHEASDYAPTLDTHGYDRWLVPISPPRKTL